MKKIFFLFALMCGLSFALPSQTSATTTHYYFEGPTILEGIDTDSLKETPTITPLNFTYDSTSAILETYETLDYTPHLNTIIWVLYQILLVLFFIGFFHLVWLFYTFFNDIL